MPIEERVEARSITPDYAALKFTDRKVAAGEHRRFVGGRWDTHGEHQFNYLVAQGLTPEHRLLDIGCGCFRAGRYFVDYLQPGHYYGIDANLPVMQAGYDHELTNSQRDRLPTSNLRANDRFDGDFGVQFDFALAQSVFSHVSLNHLQLCLYRVANVVRPGGSFYATFFVRPDNTPLDTIFAADSAKPFYHEKNAYWYRRRDLRWATTSGPWRFNYIGDWGHPSGQKMVEFVRLGDEEISARAGRKRKRVAKSRTAPKKVTATTSVPPAERGKSGSDLHSVVRRARRRAARWLDPAPR